MADLNTLIKQIALNAVEETKPTTIVFGEVTSISPLKITVDQKLELTKEFLVLTNNVQDYSVYMTLDFSTDSKSLKADDTDLTHSHTVSTKTKVTIHNGLSKGEKVMMIRYNKGQKFIVLDRV